MSRQSSWVLLGLSVLTFHVSPVNGQPGRFLSTTSSNLAASTQGQGQAISLPQLSAEKLTDPARILGGLTTGLVDVMVNLVPPDALARTDFRSKTSRQKLRPEIRKRQQEVLDSIPPNDLRVGFRFDNIAAFSAHVSENGLKALQAHPQVRSIEPVIMLEPLMAQGIALMHGMTYRSTYNGAGLAIAICDTGIDYNHSRLGTGGFPNSKVIGGYNFGDSTSDPFPNGQAHGTCCAGIAAGNLGTVGDYIGGVAYNAKLCALKITAGSGTSAATSAMVAAWDWCVTHQDDDPNNPIMVISTSFGGQRYFSSCDSATPSMTSAANNAVAAGITVISASGNDGYCDSISWPACISSVISVGAVYDAAFGNILPCVSSTSCAPKTPTGGCPTGYYVTDQSAADKVASYANVASFLTLMAPADNCYTLDISGSAGYSSGDYFSAFGGTSASCPYAAGAAASLQSAAKALTGSYLTPQQVRDLLIASGDNVTDTKVAITKPRINLQRAIESLGTNPALTFVSATVAGGNGDQSVDPNECNNVTVTIRNTGASPATNISATLTTSTAGVTITQPDSAFSNLAATQTGINATPFRISTSPSFVCGTRLSLTLVCRYGGGTNTSPFSLASSIPNYVISTTTGASIVPGVTDIGNHGSGIMTTVSLPFDFMFYGQNFDSANISANGNLQFVSSDGSSANSCLPNSSFDSAILAHWDNLRTDGTIGPAQGIYSSTSGSAPNRIFNIEWRASYYAPNRRGDPVNFEIRLYENVSKFEIIYGTLNGVGANATVGAQKDTGTAFTQFECNSGTLSDGLQLTFQQPCNDGGGPCSGAIANFMATPISGLAPLPVSFTNLSSGANSYDWNFGDGENSTATNPQHIYTNAGTYSVTLSASGPGGLNNLTLSNYIVVSSPAQLVVSPATLDFGTVLTGTVAQATFVVSNASPTPLIGNAIISPGLFAILDGFSNPSSNLAFDVAGEESTNLVISFSPVLAGTFSNVVLFASNGGVSTNEVIGRAVSPPVLVSPSLSGTELRFSFETILGKSYVIEYKDLLDDLTWQPLDMIEGDGTILSITNSTVGIPQRFYRLRLQ